MLTKALPIRMCFFIFALTLKRSPTTKSAFSIFALILTKTLPMRFFSIFPLILTKALPKRAFYSIFAIFLPKALPQMVFSLFFFTLILTKTLPKAFFLFRPHSNQIPTKKGVILYFCDFSTESPATKGVFSIFALILTKALPTKSQKREKKTFFGRALVRIRAKIEKAHFW